MRIKGIDLSKVIAAIQDRTAEVFLITLTLGCSLHKGYRVLKTTTRKIMIIRMLSNIGTTTTLY